MGKTAQLMTVRLYQEHPNVCLVFPASGQRSVIKTIQGIFSNKFLGFTLKN